MKKINGGFVLLMVCVTAYAMDVPSNITPEDFFMRMNGCRASEMKEQVGKLMTNRCSVGVYRSILQYAMTHEEKLELGSTWVCSLLDGIWAEGNGIGLKKSLRQFYNNQQFQLNKTAIDYIMRRLIQIRRAKNDEWHPIVPIDIALECLDLLTSKGVQMDCDAIFGLMQADSVLLIELLLRKGAVDPNGTTMRHKIPLWHLARSVEMFNLLIRYGNTQLHSVDEDGLTVLHRYARDSDIFGSVPELLLRLGANLNAQDPQGNTPLHLAIKRNKPAAQAWLVSKGVDCFIKNKAGEYAVPVTLSKAYTREIIVPETVHKD